jgi:transposase InsO family protein
MCKVMKVSECGYYAWFKRKPSVRARRGEYLKSEIKRVHENSKKRYGSPRITKDLNEDGIKVSQPTVAKLMKEQGIRSVIRKKFKVTTDSSHNYPVVANVLEQNFYVEEINRAWVSDLTYIHTSSGWIYLTTVIDLWDRKVIGWSLSETMKTCETTVPAFRMAVRNRNLKNDTCLIFHSDRGIQYACDEFVSETSKYKNLTRSMSRKGNCWDNAVAESFFKTLKVELIYQNRYEIKSEAMLSIFEYIETWYNRKRRHKHLNNLTLEEFHRLINNSKNAA